MRSIRTLSTLFSYEQPIRFYGGTQGLYFGNTGSRLWLPVYLGSLVFIINGLRRLNGPSEFLKDNSVYMLLYKCDGESFSTGKKCENEAEDELPTRWLSITGNIKNGLYDAHYIECNGVRHFCSRGCLENFLFKDVNPLADSPALNTMTTDPKEQPEEVKEETAENVSNEQATEGNGEATQGAQTEE